MTREIERLADEIFGLVEADQGKGFISDGLGALDSREALFSAVRNHLAHTERAARSMRRWLKVYDQL